MHTLDIGMPHDHMVREGGAEPVFQVIEGAARTCKLPSDGRRQIGAFPLPGDIENAAVHRFIAEATLEAFSF